MNLRSKFHLASTSLILVVVLGVMTSLYFAEKGRLRADIEREQREELDKLSQVFLDSRIGSDEPLLLNYVRTLLLSPKLAYAGLVEDDAQSPSNRGDGWYVSAANNGLIFNDANDPVINEVLASGRIRTADLIVQDKAITELSKPVHHGDRRLGYVRLGYSKAVVQQLFDENVNRMMSRLLIVGFITMMIALVLSSLFAAALARPIGLLMEGAESIARGKKGIKIPVAGKDELARLTSTFNHMSEELIKLDLLKDDFMSHVTHELRSPLTSIIATVELMAEMPIAQKDPKVKRSIDRLIYGSERLNRLVDNILDLTRMEAGKMTFDIKPVDMGAILAEMADFFEARAMEKGLSIKAVAPAALPVAMADSERIRQVLSNLIYNAIKFTNKGGITLWGREGDGVIQIGVQDTGVGIPADKLGSVFEKFETLKHTRDKVEKPVPGSGLGLNIVFNSIKAQNGTIWVESEIDKGSTFIFTLPLAPREAQSAARVTPAPVVENSNGAASISTPSRHPVMMNPRSAI